MIVNINFCEVVFVIIVKDLIIVGFNVFNLFNGDGNGGDFFIVCGVIMVDEYVC